MVEISAASVPALAQPGAILATAPAPASSEGAPGADFSAVLAGAAVASQTPELTTAPEPEPQTSGPIVSDLVPASVKLAGKSGSSGKDGGKMLPPGKLPVARDVAVSTKTQHASLTDQDEAASTQDAPVEQVIVDAPARTVQGEQAAVDMPIQTAPASPIPILTATTLQERTSALNPPQTAAEPANGRSVTAATRQTVAPRAVAPAGPAIEQTSATPSPSLAAQIATDSRRGNTPPPTVSNTVSPSTPVMPKAAARDTSSQTSSETVAAPPLDEVSATAALASSKAIASSQTVPVASSPVATVASPVTAKAPWVSSKATLVTTTAANLVKPDIAQPSGRAAEPTATTPVKDVAALAVAPAQTLGATPTAAAAPMPAAPHENDGALQSAALATASTPPVAPTIATSRLQAVPSAIIAPVLPVRGEAVPAPASDAPTIAVPDLPTPALDQGTPAIPVEAEVTAPLAQPTRNAAMTTTVLTTPLVVALPVGAPEAVIQEPATIALAPGQPRPDPIFAAQPVLAAAEPAEHKRALPVATTQAPATMSRPEPISIVTGNDMRTAAIFAAPVAPAAAAATTPPQDIAALVDRITEARAAAAPNTIRAALVHEDFGAVSLNFRSEASHIHVTLGSADPGFAPAVQAAAAANLANNGSEDAQHRRDAPTPQTHAQPQDATRNDSAPQQQAQRDRTSAGERQPSRQTASRQPAQSGERAPNATIAQRRSGIYA